MRQRRSRFPEIVGLSAGWRTALLLLCGSVAISFADSTVPPPVPTLAPPFPAEPSATDAPPLPPLPDAPTPDAVFSDSFVFDQPALFCPPPGPPAGWVDANCPACRDAGCPDAQCFRGVDHIGTCMREHGWTGDHWRHCSDSMVLGMHSLFDRLNFGCDLCQAGIQDSWIGDRHQIEAERANPVIAAMQCKFVNWRLNSMYLVGCIPEGYNLLWFVETVPQVEFHAGPLNPFGPIEPGSDVEQAEEIDNTTPRPLSAIALDTTPPKGELPPNRAQVVFASAGARMQLPGTQRAWTGTSFYWNASLLNHQPLYFEDVNVDRHGFTYGLAQPLISGVKFFATIPTLPYQLIAEPPQTTRYTLGEGRPGDHAPYVHQRLPINGDATAFQAAVIVGLVFLIP